MRPFAFALALLAAPAAFAQPVDPGADFYEIYCSNCHGAEAQGDGPLAKYLTVKVPMLTDLSQRNGGVFPMLEVIHRLDGSRPEVLHDSPMPDMAAVMRSEMAGYEDDYTTLMETRARILSIALYLEGLQK